MYSAPSREREQGERARERERARARESPRARRRSRAAGGQHLGVTPAVVAGRACVCVVCVCVRVCTCVCVCVCVPECRVCVRAVPISRGARCAADTCRRSSRSRGAAFGSRCCATAGGARAHSPPRRRRSSRATPPPNRRRGRQAAASRQRRVPPCSPRRAPVPLAAAGHTGGAPRRVGLMTRVLRSGDAVATAERPPRRMPRGTPQSPRAARLARS